MCVIQQLVGLATVHCVWVGGCVCVCACVRVCHPTHLPTHPSIPINTHQYPHTRTHTHSHARTRTRTGGGRGVGEAAPTQTHPPKHTHPHVALYSSLLYIINFFMGTIDTSTHTHTRADTRHTHTLARTHPALSLAFCTSSIFLWAPSIRWRCLVLAARSSSGPWLPRLLAWSKCVCVCVCL